MCNVQKGTKKIAYGLGLGKPQKDKPRWYSDQTELAIGAGNGSNLATDLTLDKHPRTGKKFRHIKIVDIKKYQNPLKFLNIDDSWTTIDWR